MIVSRALRVAAAAVCLAVLSACASPAAETSAPVADTWGPEAAGLRCRARAPAIATQGDVLKIRLDVRLDDPSAAPAGGVRFGPDLRAMRSSLECRRSDGRTVSVGAPDPYDGMPPDPDEPTRTLARKASTMIATLNFPLATAWDELPPGEYTCRVRVRWEPGREDFFRGALESSEFALRIDADRPTPLTLLLPVTLRIENDRVTYYSADAEEVSVTLRNGFMLGARIDAEGGSDMSTSLGPVPKPDDVNPIDAIHSPQQWLARAYTITVFESAEAPQHKWWPGPGTAGYREIWKRRLEPVR